MNKTQEALKMAIESMYDAGFFIDGDVGYPIFFEKAIKACEKALAEAEKQEWKSLSDDEIARLVIINEVDKSGDTGFAKLIEQALKEKNHD